MKLTIIYKILKFKQSNWLKNTSTLTLRKEKMQLIVLKKTIFKLMINSVYDKIMEKLRKRINGRLVNNEKDYLKHVDKLTFFLKRFSIKICCYS